MDEIWHLEFRSLYRIGSLKTAARELGKHRSDLVGVQVRWEKGGTERAEDSTLLYGKGNGDRQFGTEFFVHKRIVRGDRCNVTVLNVHSPCENKGDDVKDSFCQELGRVFDQFSRYDMNILLGDLNAKVGRENVFKPTISNESLPEISNDNGATVENFSTPKNLDVKSTMFPHRKIHKHSWTCPEGNAHNQIDHVLIDRRRHSSALDVRSVRAADRDTDHYLIVAKVREKLEVSKRAAQKIDTERFSLKKLNEGDVKEQYQVTIRNKFPAPDNLEGSRVINRAWDNIRENIKILA
jgi:hypothetical protein